jgi:hypothetical protein
MAHVSSSQGCQKIGKLDRRRGFAFLRRQRGTIDVQDHKLKPDFAQYGFVHQENLIMACIGGSQAHGAKVGVTDDTDWYGLYIPPPTKLLGLEREEHFVFTTGGHSEVTGP